MEVLYLYPLSTKGPPRVELEQLEHIKRLLTILTKKMEPKIKELERKIQSTLTESAKDIEAQNLAQLLNTWNEHCRRLGGHPVGPFQCRIYTEEGPYHWQYSYLPTPAANH